MMEEYMAKLLNDKIKKMNHIYDDEDKHHVNNMLNTSGDSKKDRINKGMDNKQ